MKTIKIGLFLLLCSCLISCGQIDLNHPLKSDRPTKSLSLNTTDSNLAEVATPPTIKQLAPDLEQYRPQVKIISPKPEQTLARTNIAIQLEVKDLPIFQDDRLKLGNHLNLIIDNEPLQEIYSTQEPVAIKDLSPGTHTIRVFAARPWGESFKTEGAYAQTTFNILTETNDNRPDPNLPLLTYNSPTGTYSAEPFLLDFYLSNATLHAIARNDVNLSDWSIRATVNGTSFMLKDWQPIYLTGIKPGENWVQLELIDEMGNNIENVFNNTVRVFTFDPQQPNTLAKLVTGNIPLTEAQAIVEQNYYIQPVGEPEVIDFEDDTEPKVIPGKAVDNQAESDLTPENIEDANKANEPTVSKRPTTKTNQVDQPEIIINNQRAKAEPKTIPSKEIKTQLDSGLTPLDVDNDNFEAELNSEIIEVQPEQSPETPETIVIKSPDSNLEQPITKIAIPQPESVKITESEIAITIPQTESNQSVTAVDNKPKTKLHTPLWWKKILVGLRHKIEALARLLPNQLS
jgi:hypothetical protein